MINYVHDVYFFIKNLIMVKEKFQELAVYLIDVTFVILYRDSSVSWGVDDEVQSQPLTAWPPITEQLYPGTKK